MIEGVIKIQITSLTLNTSEGPQKYSFKIFFGFGWFLKITGYIGSYIMVNKYSYFQFVHKMIL